jgi:hypothetical protein
MRRRRGQGSGISVFERGADNSAKKAALLMHADRPGYHVVEEEDDRPPAASEVAGKGRAVVDDVQTPERAADWQSAAPTGAASMFAP